MRASRWGISGSTTSVVDFSELRPKVRRAIEVLCPIGTNFGECLVETIGRGRTEVLAKTGVGWVAALDRPVLPVIASIPVDADPVVRLLSDGGRRGRRADVHWRVGHREGSVAADSTGQLREIRRFFEDVDGVGSDHRFPAPILD